jgi:hypothetical protein
VAEEVVKLVPEVVETVAEQQELQMVEIHQVMEQLIQAAEAEVEVDLVLEAERDLVLEL